MPLVGGGFRIKVKMCMVAICGSECKLVQASVISTILCQEKDGGFALAQFLPS